MSVLLLYKQLKDRSDEVFPHIIAPTYNLAAQKGHFEKDGTLNIIPFIRHVHAGGV